METTRLFDVARVKKFFDIVYKLNRACDEKYNNRCEKEVFVRRTVNKWLKGKHIILYDVSKQTETVYRRYISVSSISLSLDWSLGTLRVYIYDYARPMDLFESITVDHNTAISMEGEWIEDPTNYHNKIIELTFLNIPQKEYVFQAYDWSKYPNDVEKTNKETRKLIETTISFYDTTEYGANQQRKNYKGELMVGYDIIDIKPVKPE